MFHDPVPFFSRSSPPLLLNSVPLLVPAPDHLTRSAALFQSGKCFISFRGRMVLPTAAAAQQGVVRRAAPATEEERRRNRMTSNRLSARKSRMKRQQHVDDLATEAERLRRENEAMRAAAAAALRRGHALEQENRVLAAHARQLCAALLLRNSQLRLLGSVAGVPLDVPGVPDHLLQLYGGLQEMMPVTPLEPPPTLQLPLEIQEMLLQPDVMDAVGMLEF